MRRGGDNSQTPVRSTPENVTIRKKGQLHIENHSLELPRAEPDSEILHSLSSEISLLRQNMSEMWSSIKERFDDLSNKLSNYDGRLRTLETQACENAALKATITTLQNQLSYQTQLSLRKEVEIAGLVENRNEYPVHLTLTTALKLGMDLQEEDLDHVARAGAERQSKDNNPTQSAPHPLVVSFVRRSKRDEFLERSRSRRPLKSKDILVEGSDTTVYINERLTFNNRRLFRDTRLFAKKHGFKHCWVRSGNIFLRKGDYRDGYPAIKIQSENDLERALPTTGKNQSSLQGESSVIIS
ncbi:uncharacterized protein LOC131850117 [Achroia grisella]|uniref:uncharacterized protein LOC131850117 n=1 Tax=Achroia grisella TaxID=688607 RepID=UPI0027D2C99B|nr:uncharacterized protein LOC131850117 [Achroia grisella]